MFTFSQFLLTNILWFVPQALHRFVNPIQFTLVVLLFWSYQGDHASGKPGNDRELVKRVKMSWKCKGIYKEWVKSWKIRGIFLNSGNFPKSIRILCRGYLLENLSRLTFLYFIQFLSLTLNFSLKDLLRRLKISEIVRKKSCNVREFNFSVSVVTLVT